MSQFRPWARHYQDDPVTSELLAKGIVIRNHEQLHAAADGFLDAPFKAILSQDETEFLGMQHYTVHVRLGMSHGFLKDLDSSLDLHQFDLLTDPVLTVNRYLGAFFTYLLGIYDNLTQVIGLIYELHFKVEDGYQSLLTLLKESETRVQAGQSTPHDARITEIRTLFQNRNAAIKIREIGRYRNHLAHRKLVNSMSVVSTSANAVPLNPSNAPFQSFQAPTSPSPGLPVLTLHSGGVTFVPSGSYLGNSSQTSLNLSSFTIQPARPVKIFLPTIAKLDDLPTKVVQSDLDPREINTICTEYYDWTTDFLGRVYEILVRYFRALP